MCLGDSADKEVAALVGIDDSTLTRWKNEPEFCRAIKRAVAMRLLIRLKRIEKGESGWQGTKDKNRAFVGASADMGRSLDNVKIC